MLEIEYSNSVPFDGIVDGQPGNSVGISYVYKVTALNSDTTQTRMQWLSYPSRRLLQRFNGVLITAVQVGRLAKFDFTTLMLTMTTSLTYLTMAAVVVRLIATYCTKNRKYYQMAMYEESVNFAQLAHHHLNDLPQDQLQSMCREHQLSETGCKEELVIRLVGAAECGVELKTPAGGVISRRNSDASMSQYSLAMSSSLRDAAQGLLVGAEGSEASHLNSPSEARLVAALNTQREEIEQLRRENQLVCSELATVKDSQVKIVALLKQMQEHSEAGEAAQVRV